MLFTWAGEHSAVFVLLEPLFRIRLGNLELRDVIYFNDERPLAEIWDAFLP